MFMKDIPQMETRPGIKRVDTDSFILAFAKDKLGVNLQAGAIGRSHLLGPPVKDVLCNIIVKFISFNIRDQIYSKRFLLKGLGSRVIITEDLTRYRQSIVNELVKMRRKKDVFKFWTRECRVFAQKSEDARPIRITELRELDKLDRRLGQGLGPEWMYCASSRDPGFICVCILCLCSFLQELETI
jgi:hypothetical protein